MRQDIHPVWDLPTRLFHWLLVIAIFGAWASFELGYMTIHFYIGYSILALLLFRIAWGLVGSHHSRFADFVRGPTHIVRYLREGISPTPGHNPLGAISVLGMLALLAVQAVTGLFNGDDSGDTGPYHGLLNSHQSAWVAQLHDTVFYILLALIGVHVLAIVYYTLIRREPLTRAMLRGHAGEKKGKHPPASYWRALVILALCGALVTALVMAAPQPKASMYL